MSETQRKLQRGCIIAAAVAVLGLAAVVTGAAALRWEPTQGIIAEAAVMGGMVTVIGSGIAFCAMNLAIAHEAIRHGGPGQDREG